MRRPNSALVSLSSCQVVRTRLPGGGGRRFHVACCAAVRVAREVADDDERVELSAGHGVVAAHLERPLGRLAVARAAVPGLPVVASFRRSKLMQAA